MTDQFNRFCLFNCDNTYDLRIVEEFLVEVAEKHGFKTLVEHRYFGLRRMAEMCETTIPTMQMDYAIFVVHANESRLSINEDNAGIGYARLYRALLEKTGELSLKCFAGSHSFQKFHCETFNSKLSQENSAQSSNITIYGHNSHMLGFHLRDSNDRTTLNCMTNSITEKYC